MFQVGDILDQYRLVAEIGAGSYGRVFEVENAVTHRRFALKVVPLTGKAGERERKALELYRDLDHPNLLKIHHVGVNQDFLYYTMDLAEGKLAEQKLDAAGLLDAAAKLADALATLHAAKLLHRDIKPDNLLWRRGEPLLGDIGLVTPESEATFTGTPGFLSPRIWQQGLPPDENTDLYAFAKSFYCLLSGDPPHRYPRYRGATTPAASRLLRMVLLICDDEKTLLSAAEVRDFLRGKTKKHAMPRRTLRRHITRIVALLLIATLAVAGIYCTIVRPLQKRAAQAEFDRWQKRRMAAEKHALEKIPFRRGENGSTYTTVNDAIERSLIVRQYLEKNSP